MAPYGRAVRRGVIVLAILCGVAAIGVVFGASFAARWVLASYLEEIGASHDGLKTVRLDLLAGSASAGPLTVGGDTPARLRRAEASFSLWGLLRGRALITGLRIKGLEVDSRRDAMGAISLAGLPLENLLGPLEDRSAETAPPRKDWLLGVSNLSVVGSQILLTDLDGGEINLVIASLKVDRLLEWEPDIPTGFALDATLNGMPVRYRRLKPQPASTRTLAIISEVRTSATVTESYGRRRCGASLTRRNCFQLNTTINCVRD